MTARWLIAGILAAAVALLFDLRSERKGLLPPGFAFPERRAIALLILTFVLLLGVFSPLLTFDVAVTPDVELLDFTSLFAFQALLAISLGLWYGLGFAGIPVGDNPVKARLRGLAVFGLRARQPLRELGFGLVIGIIAWAFVLAASALLAQGLIELGAGDLLAPDAEPSPLIVWLAGLSVWRRCLISLAAGVVEEIFFRGFLQPRLGLVTSSLLFVCGHLSYGQPFMLFGIALLSLVYGWLYARRRNVWAAMAAHTLFDALQLLVVIPVALQQLTPGV